MYQLNSSMFSEFCRCCFQRWNLAVSLQGATYIPGNSQHCLGLPMGPLRPTTQLDATQSQYSKLHLVKRHGQLGPCLPPLLDNFIQTTLIYVCILGSLFCVTFPYYHSNVTYFQLSLLVFPPHSPYYHNSFFPSHLLLPFYSPSHQYLSIIFSFPNEIYLLPLVPYFVTSL